MHISALATDLYELTMMAGYWSAGMDQPASFEMYVRDLPDHRAYLVAAGLEQALDYLEHLRFTSEQIDFLRGLRVFSGIPPAFFEEYLPSFRFEGDVWAPEEGTPVFAHEPLLRVTAPLTQSQIVETALLAIVTFQTSVATKAARIVGVAGGRNVVEFGSRRAHGIEAGVLAGRAAYLAGCWGTSNVEAGFRFGIPVSGTMAHSWVMAFGDEMEAFREYAKRYGDHCVFLIDTYDPIRAAQLIAQSDLEPSAVRLDSGDVVAQSWRIRDILDGAGKQKTGIFVSGDLDEHKIEDLLATGAPITGFGVGTALATSKDAPALGGVYKLVDIMRDDRHVATIKRSTGKPSYASCKQVWRVVEGGEARWDVLSLWDEPPPGGGVPLLERVMKRGRRTKPSPRLTDLRDRCVARVRALPEGVRRLKDPEPYPVKISERLQQLTDEAKARA